MQHSYLSFPFYVAALVLARGSSASVVAGRPIRQHSGDDPDFEPLRPADTLPDSLWELQADMSRVFYQMHIPKTAGEAFYQEVMPWIKSSDELYSREYCYSYMKSLCAQQMKSGKECSIWVMLREPKEHVLSQYAMCTGSEWGRKVSDKSSGAFDTFTTWLQHFSREFTQDNFGCYHPMNMQVRALTCSGNETHNALNPPKDYERDHAMRWLQVTDSFGIAEYFPESVCLFLLEAKLQYPKWCDCNARDTMPPRVKHGVPAHSLAQASDQELAMLDHLTRYDQVLYKHATEKFVRRVKRAELEHGVIILCARH